MRRALLLTLALLLALTGCGRPAADPEPTPTDAGETTSPSEDPDEAPATQETTAWFVRFTGDGEWWVEPHATLVPPTEGVAAAAVAFLLGDEPLDDPNVSRLVDGVEVLGVDRDGDLLTVDVSDEVDAEGHSSTEESAFAQALAYTAAQFDGVRAVRLLVEGQTVEDLWGHLDWSAPIEPEPFKETPITITSPGWGKVMAQGTLTASGEANTFEATLGVRLIDPSGDVVEEEWITATSGSGTRGTWEHTFAAQLDQAGTWAIEAEEPDPSGGAEGRPPLVIRTEFTVT